LLVFSVILATSPSVSLRPASIAKAHWQWRGFDICYTAQGEGIPLLLIHGFGASIGHWRKNIPAFVEQGYRVYALDLLGFGASEKPNLDYSLELWRVLIQDFWSAHIHEPMVVVGNSIGALLSLMLLANSPEITQGGVLLNAAGGLNHRPEELNLPLRVIMGLFMRVINNPLIGPILFNQVRQRSRIRNTLKQVYGNHAAITDDLVELLYQPSCDRGAQKVFASILTAPPGPRIRDLLPKIQQPLLVLWGESDPWTPIKGSQVFQDAVAKNSAQVIPIPETGHCPHDERPDQVNPLILNWLAQLPPIESTL
jgi:pimeloyl-ACP methyl ester carboxylesterase